MDISDIKAMIEENEVTPKPEQFKNFMLYILENKEKIKTAEGDEKCRLFMDMYHIIRIDLFDKIKDKL